MDYNPEYNKNKPGYVPPMVCCRKQILTDF